MNTIQVLSSGLLSTIQDTGRRGYRKYGVPLSGVMDSYSAGLANMLLNNATNTPLIEVTLQGPTLQFNCDTMISIVGADISPIINAQVIELNKVINIKSGDILSFGKLISGCRCYLAVKGGFEIEKVLGSYSYYAGISDQHILKKGIALHINEHKNNNTIHASIKINDEHFLSNTIEVQKGPEFEMLSLKQREFLFENDFNVSTKNNRMGYQLEGNPIQIEKSIAILTSLTIPGTVQLTPAGNPIVLMRDCQTTGGYPRILQLTENGINRMAQKKTNDSIHFRR